MAPTDFDYVATRNKIIESAFRIVGVLRLGQALSGAQMQSGVDALQLLIKSWSNEHFFLWSYNLDTFPTVIGSITYNSILEDEIIGVDKAFYTDGTRETQIDVLSYSAYLDLEDRNEKTGRPTAIAFKPTPEPSIVVYPKPDAVYTINFTSISPLQDMESASGHGDLPVRFQRALKYGLAEDLFDEYPGPMNEREFVKIKAAELFAKAKRSDMPRETESEVEGFYPRR